MEDPILSFQDKKDLEKFTKHLVYKCVQVIVQSRLGEKVRTQSNATSSGADWFNLALKDIPEVTLETKKVFPGSTLEIGQCICIEMSLQTPENETMVLETWNIKMQKACDLTSVVSHTVYNRMGILLKSLVSISRATPSYRLSRRQGSDTFIICYRLYMGEPQTQSLGEGFQTVTVGSVPTPLGTVTLGLMYRTKLLISPQPCSGHDLVINLKDDHFTEDRSIGTLGNIPNWQTTATISKPYANLSFEYKTVSQLRRNKTTEYDYPSTSITGPSTNMSDEYSPNLKLSSCSQYSNGCSEREPTHHSPRNTTFPLAPISGACADLPEISKPIHEDFIDVPFHGLHTSVHSKQVLPECVISLPKEGEMYPLKDCFLQKSNNIDTSWHHQRKCSPCSLCHNSVGALPSTQHNHRIIFKQDIESDGLDFGKSTLIRRSGSPNSSQICKSMSPRTKHQKIEDESNPIDLSHSPRINSLPWVPLVGAFAQTPNTTINMEFDDIPFHSLIDHPSTKIPLASRTMTSRTEKHSVSNTSQDMQCDDSLTSTCKDSSKYRSPVQLSVSKDLLFSELHAPFAVKTETGGLAHFYRELQGAGEQPLFGQHLTVEETFKETTDQLRIFEVRSKEYDEFVESLQADNIHSFD